MANLTLIRPSEWQNIFSKYTVLLNDKPVAYLANNSHQTLQVEAEKITLRARVYWCSSASKLIILDADEHKQIEISGNRTFQYVMIPTGIALILVTIALFIYGSSGFIQFMLSMLSTIGVLYPLFNMTVNRNKYLYITVTEK